MESIGPHIVSGFVLPFFSGPLAHKAHTNHSQERRFGALKTGGGGGEQMASWSSRALHLHRWLPRCPLSATLSLASAVRSPRKNQKRARLYSVALRCSSAQDVQQSNDIQQLDNSEEEDVGIMCEPCNGTGWLLCEFCKGQKTNVKAENNRIYRRCPTCRAIGYIICSKCKVFKCVTFPDFDDGDLSTT